MADHIRTQIRDAVVTLLTGLPTTGANVFAARPYPLASTERPGIVVMTPSEASEVDAMGADPPLLRRIDLVVIGYHQGEAIEDLLDAIAAEVEAALGAAPRLGGAALDTTLAATALSADEEGKKRMGEIRMTFAVLTRTTRGVPTAFV